MDVTHTILSWFIIEYYVAVLFGPVWSDCVASILVAELMTTKQKPSGEKRKKKGRKTQTQNKVQEEKMEKGIACKREREETSKEKR